ncbi:MAG: hypothetical protein EBE86_030865 [Hormoscilla sp. GUM202]|nr:hypothetical protein [Hormoscilla sp. GM7CHS1pb]MBO1351492.1 hypothetical protein [Hormoscilla sp. GUM202]
MAPLGYELQQRGHRVTLFGVLDMEPKTVAAGLEFWAIGVEEFPLGWAAERDAQLGKLNGLAALRYTIGSFLQRETMMHLREAPEAM